MDGAFASFEQGQTLQDANENRAVSLLLSRSPTWAFSAYAIAVSFSAYFCMYAFRKPFAAAKFEGQSFFTTDVDLKTALVISQIVGYAISKYVGIKVCSEVTPRYRAGLMIVLICFAELSLCLYGLIPDQWKFAAIFLNGLPLGMVWGLVVWYLEGRTISEILLAGLSLSFILASGIVKNIGQWLMSDYGFSEGWMPAATGAIFLAPFMGSVWLLSQLPPPTVLDEQARAQRKPMDSGRRLEFVKKYFWGLLMLVVAYFFLTAYRDYRDNYQPELFEQLGYSYDENKTIITRAELLVMFFVTVPLGALFLIRKNRAGLIGTYGIMALGVTLLGASTVLLQRGTITGFWWMTLIGLGSYMAYIPYGSVLFDRLMATTKFPGTAVFAIYLMDAIGYTGSVVVQLYRDVFYTGSASGSRLEFFIDFTYVMSILGAIMFLSSCSYFLVANRDTATSRK